MISMGEFEEIPAVSAGKRLGVQWAPWMGDWFTSWSPRNSNSNAEGQWDQWVDLAIQILRDPLTEKVRPEARAAALQLQTYGFYAEVRTRLTDSDLDERFRKPSDDAADASPQARGSASPPG